MKAQFATIEAIISLLLVVVFIGFAQTTINNSNGREYSARQLLVSNLASYDFINQISENYSSGECMNSYIAGNGTCLSRYMQDYISIYGLSSFRVIFGKGNFSEEGKTTCFPYNSLLGKEELCIEAD
jgi:hypothetical protein